MHPSLAHVMSNCTRSENGGEYRKQDGDEFHLGLVHHTKKKWVEDASKGASSHKHPCMAFDFLLCQSINSLHYYFTEHGSYHFQVTLKCFS